MCALQDSAEQSGHDDTDDDLSISVTGSSLSADFGFDASTIHGTLPLPVGPPAASIHAQGSHMLATADSHARMLDLEDQLSAMRHDKQMLELRLDRIHRASEAERKARNSVLSRCVRLCG